MAMLTLEDMRRESAARGQQIQQQTAAAQANHQSRLTQLAATGRPISANYSNTTTGVANLAADDAAWQSGGGIERMARMEYDLAPGVRQMDAAQLREFVESGGAAAWRAGANAQQPAATGDPFGGAGPAFEAQLGFGTAALPPSSAGGSAPVATPAATPTAPGSGAVSATAPSSPAQPSSYGGTTVAERLDTLLQNDNALIRQARAQGLAAGNRRGLLNSSMAAGAAQGEAYKVALPIAQQDAAQAHQTNLANADIAAQMDRLRTQAGFNTEAQVRDLQAQFERLRYSSDADDQRQARDIAAQLERLGVAGAQQIGAIQAQGQVQSGLQTQSAAAEMARLEAQLANANAQQAVEIRAQMDRLRESGAQQSGLAQQQFGFQQQLNAQTAELESRRIELQGSIQSALQAQGAQQQTAFARVQNELQQVLQSQANDQQLQRMGAEFAQQRDVQQREIAAQMERLVTSGNQELSRLALAHQQEMTRLGAQIAAGDRQAIAQSMMSIFSAETAMRQALLANTTMPAAERAAYEQAISSLGDPARAFINQLYSVPGQSAVPAPPAAVAPPAGDLAAAPAPAGLDPAGVLTQPPAGSGFGLMPPGYYGGPGYEMVGFER